MACFLLACTGQTQVVALTKLLYGLPVKPFSMYDSTGVLAWKAVTSLPSFSESFACRKSSKHMCLTVTLVWLTPSNALQSDVFPAPGRPHVTARQSLAFKLPQSAAEVIYMARWISAEAGAKMLPCPSPRLREPVNKLCKATQ